VADTAAGPATASRSAGAGGGAGAASGAGSVAAELGGGAPASWASPGVVAAGAAPSLVSSIADAAAGGGVASIRDPVTSRSPSPSLPPSSGGAAGPAAATPPSSASATGSAAGDGASTATTAGVWASGESGTGAPGAVSSAASIPRGRTGRGERPRGGRGAPAYCTGCPTASAAAAAGSMPVCRRARYTSTSRGRWVCERRRRPAVVYVRWLRARSAAVAQPAGRAGPRPTRNCWHRFPPAFPQRLLTAPPHALDRHQTRATPPRCAAAHGGWGWFAGPGPRPGRLAAWPPTGWRPGAAAPRPA
jgi:hypothetical protein